MSCRVPFEGLPRYSAVFALIFPFLLMFILLPARPVAAFEARSLGDFDNVAVMEVTGNFDAIDGYGRTNLEPRRVIAREFYRTHGDDYDFLVIFTNFDIRMLSPQTRAFFWPSKNDVLGIGLELYNYTSGYTPTGYRLARLQGTIDMANVAGHVLEPADPEFDDTLQILTHEMMHRWGAYVNYLDNGVSSDALLGFGGVHWSFLLDADGSSLYGNNWRDNGDGTFTTLAPEQGHDGQVIGRIINPLELYLMGLADKSQVPPLLLIDAPGIDKEQLPEIGVTIPGTVKSIGIDDIIAAMGERIPSFANSRKEFRMAFIHAVIPGSWSEGNARDREVLASISRLRTEWEQRFSILTDGAGMMRTALIPSKAGNTNPDTPDPETTPATESNVNAGIAWLLSRQHDDGSWYDQSGTALRDTAMATGALRLFPAGTTSAARGRDWLVSSKADNNDFRARALFGGDDAKSAEIAALQNADGGWGSAPGFRSNPIDTALALRALTARNGGYALSTTIGWLHAAQNPDGGWNSGVGESRVQPTAEALLALNDHRQGFPLEPIIAEGLAWLVARQNADGGFGSPGTVIETAVALQAIKGTGASPSAANDAVNWLLARQADTGSWNGSVFQTAGAVAALHAGQVAADLVVETADITCVPALVGTVPAEITVSVNLRNLGSDAVSGAEVSLYDGEPALGRLLGTQWQDVAGHGASLVSFATTISEVGLWQFHVVIDGNNLIDEANEWNNEAVKILPVNQPPPVIGFTLPTSTGSEAQTKVPIAVVLGYPWSEPITVNYTVNAGTASPAADYVPLAGSLTFVASETNKVIDITIINDPIAESDKTVSVELAAPNIGTLGTARHLYTIRDDEVPTVTIASPTDGVIGSNRPQLLFTTTGNNVVVRVDGVVVGKASGDTLDNLADGAHSVEVTVANSFGMTTTTRVGFVVDSTLPTVVIRAPFSGAVTGPHPVLDYTVTSAVRQEVLVDGIAVDKGAGALLGPLLAGPHVVAVNAWNAAGAKSSAQVVFEVDARPPLVEIFYPANEYIHAVSPVLLCRSDEAGRTVVWLDGVETGTAAGEPLGPLGSGVHRLRVTVTDAVGNVGSDEAEFAIATQGEAAYVLADGWPKSVEGYYGGMTIDRSGNVVVVTKWKEKEFDIVKLDPTGRELWRVTRSSYFNIWGGNWVDTAPTDIAVDSHGNIYVGSVGFYVSRDYSVLAKYDADGKYLGYVLLDTGMLYGNVQILSVDVDDNDDVYISGNTTNDLFSATHTTPATMFVAKYNSQLGRLHGRSYGGDDRSAKFYFVSLGAMTVDDDGNVYVVGSDGGNRLSVWKLAPDLARTGVASSGDLGTSGADIDVDAFGNIYVAGNGPAGGTVWKFGADGNQIAMQGGVSPNGLQSLDAGNDGIVTVLDAMGTVTRLDADFTGFWSTGLGSRLNAKIVPDKNGELFVGGNDNSEAATVIARLSDPRHPRFNFDRPVIYANSGFVILSGYLDPGYEVTLKSHDCHLVDYRHDAVDGNWQMAVSGLSEGEVRIEVSVMNGNGFARRYNTRVVVDTIAPCVVITAPADRSSWTNRPVLSYTADAGEVEVFVNGVEVTKRSAFPLDSLRPGENRIRVQSIDLAGNVGFDEVVIQATGNAIGEYPLEIGWTGKLGTAGDQTVVDLGEDALGNIYLLGDTTRGFPGYSDSSRDLFVAKYDPMGRSLAFWQLDGSFQDYGAALAVTAAGGFLVASNVTGYDDVAGRAVNSMVIAGYSASGALLWKDKLDSGAEDHVDDLAVDTAGNIYACGTTRGRLNNKRYGGGRDYFLIKYSPQGSRLWTVLSNAPSDDVLNDIELFGDGFLYATGRMNDTGELSVFKFDLNGALVWKQDYALVGEDLVGKQLEIGRDGSLYSLAETSSPDRYVVTKHNPQGGFVKDVFGQASAIKGLGLALDAASNIHVTGWADDPNGLGWSLDGSRSFGDEDVFVAKHAAGDLRRLWTRQIGDADAQQGHEILFSRVNGQGYLAGVTDGEFGGPDSDGQDVFLSLLAPLVDRVAPELTITGYRSPTNQPFQVVSGYATPGAGINALLAAPAGSPGVVVPVVRRSDGSWQVAVDALAGNADNLLSVCAGDGANTVCESVSITVDTIPPQLMVDPVNSPTPLAAQTVGGWIEPGATLRLAGMTAPIPVVDSVWSQIVDPLHIGENILMFTAVDAAGNVTTRPVTIVRIPPPPPILTVNPAVLPADEPVDIVLTVSGIEPPDTEVIVSQLFDLDGNGFADPGEPLVRRFAVTDGRLADNPNLPADEDGIANGAIVVALNGQFVNDRYHAPGEYVFTVTATNGSDSERFGVIAAAQLQTLSGTVRNGSGAPLGGALVELQDAWGRSFGFAMSDVTGAYRFAVRRPGDYLLVPTLAGYCHDRTTASKVAVAAGAAAMQDLVMMAGSRQVSGRVSDAATSAGLAGVLVRAANEHFLATTMTSTDGSYLLHLPDGAYGLSIETRPGDGLASLGYPGSRLPQRSISVASDLAGCDLPVAGATSLVCGTVTTSVGLPAPGIPVQAAAGDASGVYAEATSDASGRYCLALSPGATWQFGLGETAAYGAGVVGTVGTSVNPVLTVYPVDAWVSGAIRDETGRSVAGMTVAAVHADGARTTIKSETGGRYLLGISSAPSGAWSLDVNAEEGGYAPVEPVALMVAPGQTEGRDFTLEKPRSVNTINIVNASYDNRKKLLNVEATSNYDNARLQVESYGPMSFSRWFKGKYYWVFSGSFPAKPLAVTVSGPEGAMTIPVR